MTVVWKGMIYPKKTKGLRARWEKFEIDSFSYSFKNMQGHFLPELNVVPNTNVLFKQHYLTV